ncbi:MBL fold metallo-hydrolase [Haloferax mediterranei ATCC 33500]|uniref:MBL fold metallo-hydrolase n=1 Tax=Haloferax mediterranei (strain ATCC 33500 / DSM 1411 / JCM 8866 / NBRC 14739 / NCIMB 2177 / R-4) TaxID=523841 RepID=I3R3E3_HALMT|nr:MBL fold metallo-hydrolase [Haloferax mediterranei]AFK18753.1 metallo-beta-lactamase superfamily protein [Haloferax mediterranei ATCC 33500]AHZ21879.1 metallo-beta-lactamase [Haloferax mediterranei ATCC 33500]EMA03387.1 metallo-beta-lactamase superfamily protein [Haloferax mediterranei ATCC 33500]MDX5988849.1 MBL fold metallo-hydrolase [Haloferax mediterranei ATCC 33500]QCQ75249.1 MBL fold metallo-hydrolase [Haloferax mediterranei ATCC 33500]
MSALRDSVRRFRLRGVNAYLVSDDGDVVLVDAGTPWDRDRMLRGLVDAGLTAGDIDRVLVTHYDLDHVGTLAALGLRSDVPIHIAEPDASYVTGQSKPPIRSHKGLLQRLFSPLLERPTNPVEVVNDGDELGGFVAYRTPGHTPGHTAYVHEQHGVAFVGDMARESDGKLAPTPWVMTANRAENRRSIREFADRCPAVDVIATGHGDPILQYGYGALKRLADRV